MSGPEPNRQKQARSVIKGLFKQPENVWVTHYSCESFYDRPEGRSPRITSLALRNLESGQTASFSIHQVAERLRVAPIDISAKYDQLELNMLTEFFEHIRAYRTMKYLHWNMRDINYGFAAIEHRHRVLGGEPFVVDDRNKFDLARILIEVYGIGYTGHPRLQTLLEKNKIKALDMLNGAEEAAAFDEGKYVELHRSTLRKVDIIANLATRTHDNTLRTNTTWWQMHGGRVRNILGWMAESKTFQLIAGLASIVGLAITIWVLK
jgi:hypothetical protein